MFSKPTGMSGAALESSVADTSKPADNEASV